MAHKIDEIEGIGPAYAEKLRAAGLDTTEALLAKGGTAKGREEIVAATGIAAGSILRWVNHADLMRIKGIGKQYAELLEAAGVDTVKELKNRNAANLAAKMAEVNAEKKLSGNSPSEAVVAAWIAEAKTLAPAVSH
jgi:predicted flap endonuclease-1-like 5' DNA nuclease